MKLIFFLLSTAFVLILSVFCPAVVLLLWYLWAKCYDPNEDNDDLPNKHLSLAAQVISWVLGCCIIVTLLLLLAFGTILIIANERVGVAVTNSGNAIKETLPTVGVVTIAI